MSDTAKKWASLLRRLTHSKTSIDTAASFALQLPARAAELLAAVVARVQDPAAENDLASLYLFDCICKRAKGEEGAASRQFIPAANTYAPSILRGVLSRGGLRPPERQLVDSARSILVNWERKRLFRPEVLLEAREILSEAEASLAAHEASSVDPPPVSSSSRTRAPSRGNKEATPAPGSSSSCSFSPPRPPSECSDADALPRLTSPAAIVADLLAPAAPPPPSSRRRAAPSAAAAASSSSSAAAAASAAPAASSSAPPDPAADPAAAFMEAIEANRAVSKRRKIEARLRPRPLSWDEEFSLEWDATPSPRDGEVFALAAAALPFGDAAVGYPYVRPSRAASPAWAQTNYDLLNACVAAPRPRTPRRDEAQLDIDVEFRLYTEARGGGGGREAWRCGGAWPQPPAGMAGAMNACYPQPPHPLFEPLPANWYMLPPAATYEGGWCGGVKAWGAELQWGNGQKGGRGGAREAEGGRGYRPLGWG
ncbi:hypothetical protein AB1Y20_016617 [Prymnesium parvum]|uniref:CID domain-containing protein n=1 Tax=Prymnesium parvum TaxID=97485 RepID=A0AB34IE22_PRYPA